MKQSSCINYPVITIRFVNRDCYRDVYIIPGKDFRAVTACIPLTRGYKAAYESELTGQLVSGEWPGQHSVDGQGLCVPFTVSVILCCALLCSLTMTLSLLHLPANDTREAALMHETRKARSKQYNAVGYIMDVNGPRGTHVCHNTQHAPLWRCLRGTVVR